MKPPILCLLTTGISIYLNTDRIPEHSIEVVIPWINYTDILWAFFINNILWPINYTNKLQVENKKAARKMLMKLTPVVNFTFYVQSTCVPIFLHPKLHIQTVSTEDLRKASYKKFALKMLVKLPPCCSRVEKLTP